MYIVLVTLAALVHFTFCIYVVVGGFLAVHWRRTIWVHVAAVCLGLGSLLWHPPSPLTWLERVGRTRAGIPPLPADNFIAHYITGVAAPAGWVAAIDIGMFVLVIASWLLFLRRIISGALVRAAATTTKGHTISVRRTARSASPRNKPSRVRYQDSAR